MITIVSFVLRGLQLLFGAVVLGLSVNAIRWQEIGSAPATTSYSAFAGAFCMLVALIGIAAIWINALAGLIMACIDALASVLLVAGGIAFAVGMKGLSCGNFPAETRNKLINGGCISTRSDTYCWYDDEDTINKRCQMARADTAFLFLGFAASIAAAVLCMFQMKRGTGRHSAV